MGEPYVKHLIRPWPFPEPELGEGDWVRVKWSQYVPLTKWGFSGPFFLIEGAPPAEKFQLQHRFAYIESAFWIQVAGAFRTWYCSFISQKNYVLCPKQICLLTECPITHIGHMPNADTNPTTLSKCHRQVLVTVRLVHVRWLENSQYKGTETEKSS